ncbi:amino acid ABC transporter permease [Nitratidesulfovibrio sp. D1]|uniref:amino acid ABC transporter permease n=1 Tax=Nitratidesulfovibrio sp. D1 TaxID=3440151 RepID=UPI003EBFAF2F
MSHVPDFSIAVAHLPALLQGAAVTLGVSLASIVAGLGVGMAVCLCRISRRRPLAWAARAFISALRGIPILVLLLIVFYMLPLAGIELPPVAAAIIALSLNSGAFQAEIYRGGFASIPPGQAEAARALGMGEGRILRRILIPQVLVRVLPSLVNELIMLLKNSSLTSAITVVELLRASQQVVAATYRPTEIYLTAALLYVVMSTGLSALGGMVRARLAGRGRVTA